MHAIWPWLFVTQMCTTFMHGRAYTCVGEVGRAYLNVGETKDIWFQNDMYNEFDVEDGSDGSLIPHPVIITRVVYEDITSDGNDYAHNEFTQMIPVVHAANHEYFTLELREGHADAAGFTNIEISYIALRQGEHMFGSLTMYVGLFTSPSTSNRRSHNFADENFLIPFSDGAPIPTLFLQAQGDMVGYINNGEYTNCPIVQSWAMTHSSFSFDIYTRETKNDTYSGSISIGYVVVEKGDILSGDMPFSSVEDDESLSVTYGFDTLYSYVADAGYNHQVQAVERQTTSSSSHQWMRSTAFVFFNIQDRNGVDQTNNPPTAWQTTLATTNDQGKPHTHSPERAPRKFHNAEDMHVLVFGVDPVDHYSPVQSTVCSSGWAYINTAVCTGQNPPTGCNTESRVDPRRWYTDIANNAITACEQMCSHDSTCVGFMIALPGESHSGGPDVSSPDLATCYFRSQLNGNGSEDASSTCYAKNYGAVNTARMDFLNRMDVRNPSLPQAQQPTIPLFVPSCTAANVATQDSCLLSDCFETGSSFVCGGGVCLHTCGVGAHGSFCQHRSGECQCRALWYGSDCNVNLLTSITTCIDTIPSNQLVQFYSKGMNLGKRNADGSYSRSKWRDLSQQLVANQYRQFFVLFVIQNSITGVEYCKFKGVPLQLRGKVLSEIKKHLEDQGNLDDAYPQTNGFMWVS